ncbi:MAG: LamG-like jellyroll fold domain-containing protein [Sandaracinaceae bacterium]
MRSIGRPLFIPLALLGLGGCSLISSFDFEYRDATISDGGGNDGGRRDGGGTDGGRRDADAPFDAGPDAGPMVDGGTPSTRCPAPCVADAVTDFEGATAPGVGSVDWRAHRDDRAPIGVDFPELVYGSHPTLTGFGDTTAFVGHCADNAGAAECAGLADHLLVIGRPGAGGADPVISFHANARAVWRVQGRVRLAAGVSSAETHRISISRNARHDYAGSTELVPTATPMDFDALVDVLDGDRVIVRFEQRSGSTAAPLAVQLWVTRMGAPVDDRCQVGLTFDNPQPLYDRCVEADVENRVDGIGPATTPSTASTLAEGVGNWLREGRVITEGQYLVAGTSPLDYSGDFTVSIWARASTGPTIDQVIFADSTSDAPPGGTYVSIDTDYDPPFVVARTFHPMTMGACTEARPGVCIAFSNFRGSSANEWHYYRYVRSTADDAIYLCVDGQQRLRIPLDGSYDLTTAYRLTLARNVDFNPADFVGRLDDARVYSIALPCEL